MPIVVIEQGHPNGMDLVMPTTLDKFVDYTEFREGRKPGIDFRASEDGVLLYEHRLRLVGVSQARTFAKVLLKAADEAEKRGAPSHVKG